MCRTSGQFLWKQASRGDGKMTIADSAREGKRGEGRSMPWAKLVGQIAQAYGK
jgi:hypothetical protein